MKNRAPTKAGGSGGSTKAAPSAAPPPRDGHLRVLLDGLYFPEAPRWRDGRLWFSDFYSHQVATLDLAGRTEVVAQVPHQPSGLGWTPRGELLIVSMLDHKVLRLTPQGLVCRRRGIRNERTIWGC